MGLPPAQGLYDPRFEHDACGLGFVATLQRRGHARRSSSRGSRSSANLTHRGAAGCDPAPATARASSLQIPHALYAAELAHERHRAPAAGRLRRRDVLPLARPGALPPAARPSSRRAVMHHGQRVIGWRDVPVDIRARSGPSRAAVDAVIRQLFIGARADTEAFERMLFMIRKRAGARTASSARRLLRRVLLVADRRLQGPDARRAARGVLPRSRRPDDREPRSRWCTRASRPTRSPPGSARTRSGCIAHNGEINTLRGNAAWMRAREALLEERSSSREDIDDFKPIIRPAARDSAALDNVVDFLVASGRSLPHVMMMLVPEAWAHDPTMPPSKKAFYEYHACLVEPWDGPAALCFTDGTLIGATLDRNGLRPAQVRRHDRRARRAGERVRRARHRSAATSSRRGGSQPGKMFLVDTVAGSHRLGRRDQARGRDAEAVRRVGRARTRSSSRRSTTCRASTPIAHDELRARSQQAFGYTRRRPAHHRSGRWRRTARSRRARWAPTSPLAVLSRAAAAALPLLQAALRAGHEPADRSDPRGARDVARELRRRRGQPPRGDAASRPRCSSCRTRSSTQRRPREAAQEPLPRLSRRRRLPMLLPGRRATRSAASTTALDELCRAASRAIADGASILILSDRGVDERHAADPEPARAPAAVHHHLIREGTRMRVGIVVETGEPREVAPPRAAHRLRRRRGEPVPRVRDHRHACAATRCCPATQRRRRRARSTSRRSRRACSRSCRKMGISTLSSYHGAQIFEAIGLAQVVDRPLLHRHRVAHLAASACARSPTRRSMRHERAYPARAPTTELDVGGQYHYRAQRRAPPLEPGDASPQLQKAVRARGREAATTSTRSSSTTSRDSPINAARPLGLRARGPAGPARRGRARDRRS